MRWKERFLVPDHRIRSINGASYAGFYYVCLEFGSVAQNLYGDALHSSSRSTRREGSVGSTSTSTRARRNSSRHSIGDEKPTPATGTNRIRRGSRAEGGRRRRLSIYTAGAGNYSNSSNAHHYEQAIDLNEALSMEPPVQEEDRMEEDNSVSARDDGEIHRDEYTVHGNTKKWTGPAKLTGYYYHSEKDLCDM